MSKAQIPMLIEHDGEDCDIQNCGFLEVSYFSVSSHCRLFDRPVENIVDSALRIQGCKRCAECVEKAVPAEPLAVRWLYGKTYTCSPDCGGGEFYDMMYPAKPQCCPFCGQGLLWGSKPEEITEESGEEDR